MFVCIYIYVCIYTSTYLYVYTHMYYTTTWHLLIYAYILHIHPLSSRFNQPLDAIFFRKNLTHTWQVSTCRCDIDRAHHSCVGNCQWFCPNDWKVKDDQFLSFFLFFWDILTYPGYGTAQVRSISCVIFFSRVPDGLRVEMIIWIAIFFFPL